MAKARALQSLQVNFLTMNRVSLSTGAGRVIDSLGDTRTQEGLNQPVRIPLATSQIWDNLRFNQLEPTGDVIDQNGQTVEPDLDIVDWSVEVRLP